MVLGWLATCWFLTMTLGGSPPLLAECVTFSEVR